MQELNRREFVENPKPTKATRERVSELLNAAGAGVCTITVCLLPWLLGGTIPEARLVLLAGSALSAVCSTVGMIAGKNRTARVPVGVLLLLGLAIIGTIQLLPIHLPLTFAMDHATFPELRSQIVGSVSGAEFPGTATPARTRLFVAQWLCLCLLLMISCDTIRTPRRLRFCLSCMTINACALTVIALIQSFRDVGMLWGAQWTYQDFGNSFGPIVNRNGAAGWLCVSLGAGIGLLLTSEAEWGNSILQPSVRKSYRTALNDIGLSLQKSISGLTPSGLLNGAAVSLIMAGIATTRSRAGILAALAGISVALLCALFSMRRSMLILSLVLLCCGTCGFLVLFELNDGVLSEMATLDDPVSESTVRILHWSDTLQSVRDFPWLGSGLGAYRFATLPYLTQGIRAWFMNADNQFVEMLVESGITGFLCFAGSGLLIALTGLQLLARTEAGKSRSSRSMHALGLTCGIIAVSQALSATFDFGTGLPATSAAIVLLWGAATAALQTSQKAQQPDTEYRVDQARGLLLQLPFWLAVSMKSCILIGTLCYLPDVWSAVNVFRNVVAAERALTAVSSNTTPEELGRYQSQLETALLRRPDDPDGLQSLFDIQEACFRKRLIDAASGSASLAEPEFQKAWQQLSITGLADQILAIRRSADPSVNRLLVRDTAALLRQSPVESTLTRILKNIPLMPGTRVNLIAYKLITDDQPLPDSEGLKVLFSEPGNSRRLFQVGYFYGQQNQLSNCRKYWEHALTASDTFRRAVLEAAQIYWSPPDAVSMFGPQTYEDAVRLASEVPAGPLRRELWLAADRQWESLKPPQTVSQNFSRIIHLTNTDGDEAASQWAAECLVDHPENTEFRTQLANLLEKQGKVSEAISEWHRIEHFDPGNRAASAALRRLNRRQDR